MMMNTQVEVTEKRVQLTRLFNAPRELVFKVWTRPEHVSKWWGCKGTYKVDSTMDFKVGGAFTHVMHTHDNGVLPYKGIFVEITEPSRISWDANFAGGKSHVVVDFIPQGAQTLVTLTLTGSPGMDYNLHVSVGFKATLDRLTEVLEKELAAV